MSHSSGISFEDLFESRQLFALSLREILKKNTSSKIISIDAEWGLGKTFFLEGFKPFLEEENILVLNYNAWENDYEKDPFSSLIFELLPQIRKAMESNAIIENVIDGVLSTVAATAITVTKIIAPVAYDIGKDFIITSKGVYKNRKLKRNQKQLWQADESVEHSSIRRFKASLDELYKHIHDNKTVVKKIVIMIDELDRCRPDYAIELLERVKHIFSVDNYSFIFTLNKASIESNLRHRYGEKASEGYLTRFFDYDLKLPLPDLKEFVDNLEWINNGNEKKNKSFEILKAMILRTHFSLRMIERIFDQFSVMINAVADFLFKDFFTFFLPLCMITRYTDETWNHQFFVENTAMHFMDNTQYEPSSFLSEIYTSIVFTSKEHIDSNLSNNQNTLDIFDRRNIGKDEKTTRKFCLSIFGINSFDFSAYYIAQQSQTGHIILFDGMPEGEMNNFLTGFGYIHNLSYYMNNMVMLTESTTNSSENFQS